MKRVVIVHGWGGSPNEALHAWLRTELEQQGYEVVAPLMPDSEHPVINAWVNKLREVIETPNKDTILVGHSIGCQAIMRYLETLDAGVVGGVVFIAPWLTLTGLESDEEWGIVKPWLETPIDFVAVKKHTPRITAIFSDDDKFVPIENAQLFKEKLGTSNIIEHAKGHFTNETGVERLPSALNAILSNKD